MEDGKSVTVRERTGRTSSRCEIEGARRGKARKQSSVHRPVQRLIPFEIREKSAVNREDEVDMQENTVSEEEIPQETEIQDVVSNARPSRKAAV